MIESIVRTIFDWQDLVGAMVGGLIGIIGALIVAEGAKKYEQRAAAMLVVIDLISVNVAVNKLSELAAENQITEEDKAFFMADKIAFMFPKLSPLFEASMLRILPIDMQLAAHLTLLNSMYRDLEPIISRVRKDANLIDAGKEIERPEDQLFGDIKIIRGGVERLEKQAEAATYYINHIILDRFSKFYLLRRWFWKNEDEKKFMSLLKSCEG